MANDATFYQNEMRSMREELGSDDAFYEWLGLLLNAQDTEREKLQGRITALNNYIRNQAR